MTLLYVVGKHSTWAHNELRYSLRSVCVNMPHTKVVIVGHAPQWFAGDVIPMGDPNIDRNRNIHLKILKALESGLLGDRFALMCDDIYILKPWTTDAIRYVGMLGKRLERIRRTHPGHDPWRRAMESTLKVCRGRGDGDPYDCSTHHPVVMETDKAIETVKFSMGQKVLLELGTIYVSMHGGEVVRSQNAKTIHWKGEPTGPVYSSGPQVENNKEFRRWIDGVFPEPCQWEV